MVLVQYQRTSFTIHTHYMLTAVHTNSIIYQQYIFINSSINLIHMYLFELSSGLSVELYEHIVPYLNDIRQVCIDTCCCIPPPYSVIVYLCAGSTGASVPHLCACMRACMYKAVVSACIAIVTRACTVRVSKHVQILIRRHLTSWKRCTGE
jgi:hypothetical protein